MEAMEEDDPVLYWSLINYIMADESTDLCSDSVQRSDLPGPLMEMAVGADEELDDEADDFELLSLLLRQESAAAPPSLFSEADLLDEHGDPRQGNKTPRGKQRKRDPGSSRFQKYLDVGEAHRDTCDSIWDENTWEGKQFRRRFRLPFAMFDELCNNYEAVDPRNSSDAFKNPKSNIRLLILGTLRVLGQALPFDSVEELNDISTDKNNKFFKEFVNWLPQSEYAIKYLRYPETEQELQHVSDHYAKLLVPGCGGSVDCVHIAWDMCPAGIRSDCKGKEGYPSVVFQVICSHTRKVLGVSGPYYGTWNDKTIARLDDNFKLFMSGGTLSNLNWTWTDDNAAIHQEKGMFLICDGGYHFWKMLICPFKDQPDGSSETTWSGLIESLRKDVECLFGILKKRFMVLKHAVRYHNLETISDVFRTCCILHNMLLEHDEYDDWQNSSVVLEEDLLNVETIGITNRFGHEGFTRTVESRATTAVGQSFFGCIRNVVSD
jgi:hypothetical protein